MSAAQRPTVGFAAYQELRQFLSPKPVEKGVGGRVRSTTAYRFETGETIDVDDDGDGALRSFVRNAGAITEHLHPTLEWNTGAGPLARGSGLERHIIAHELAATQGVEDIGSEEYGHWSRDVLAILSFLSQISQRRYEKVAPHLTIAYLPEERKPGDGSFGTLGTPLLDQYKGLLRMFRDGHTIIMVKRGGVIVDLLDNRRFDPALARLDDPPVPPRLAHLQQLTTGSGQPQPVVFNLNSNASVEILSAGQLVFRRINQSWRYLRLPAAFKAVTNELRGCGSDRVAHNLLTLALDLADRGEGALLCLYAEPTDEVLNHVLLPDEGLIRALPGLPFQELTVRTRFTQLVGRRRLSLGVAPYHAVTPLLADLASIDGATVFSYHGELLGFGCLVRLASDPQAKRQEGARTAASKQVSRYGIAVKVSSDGYATLFIRAREWGRLC